MNVNDYLQEHDSWMDSQRQHVTPGKNPGKMRNTGKTPGKTRNLRKREFTPGKTLVNCISFYQDYIRGFTRVFTRGALTYKGFHQGFHQG